MGRFLSPNWHRVAELKPRLGEHAQVHRHRYRGELWYVIDDRHAGRVHRFTPAAFQFLARLNGERTVDAVWREAVRVLGEQAPGQEDIVQLLGQLHANDLLKCDVLPDTGELFARYNKQSRSLWFSNLKNPMSIRIPLWDPDEFLKATLPWVGPIFSRTGLLVWLAVVLSGLVLASEHWNELSKNVSDQVLAAHNLLILGLTFPLVKTFHEIGHAYAARRFGGEVHEIGLLFLVLMPVPYVDASSSAGFPDKWLRAMVGAAGMMVELFLASLALAAWTSVEPGLFRSFLYDVMVIASVSTVVFNGNPLLRYDGYYILSDLIEIPNLGQRANRYWGYLCDRYLFGVREAKPETLDPAERRWCIAYGPAAYAYRCIVMFGIALFLAQEFFFVGVALALWSAFTALVLPVLKGIRYVLANPRLNATRRRAVLATLGLVACLGLLLALLPLPLRTQSEGILWRPERAEVRTGTAGFVHRILVPSGTVVGAGDPLVACEDPVLSAEIAVHRAKVEELKARRNAEWVEDKVQAELTRDELRREEAALARAAEREAKLLVRSPVAGRLVLTQEDDLPGRFYQQGELLGFVVDGSSDIVRAVVTQDNIDLVRRSLRSVEVRFAPGLAETYPARLLREIPAAGNELPSAALGTEGGGTLALDPTAERDRATAVESIFQFDLAIPAAATPSADGVPSYGARVHVRFDHQPEPAVRQIWRRLRQIFLSRSLV
jgi:putative peptide zinc metalloprotease protein